MSRRKKPHQKTRAGPPGAPRPRKGGKVPFWLEVGGRRGRRGDHAGKGSSGWLPKTG
jgi:hypothetical protein